jgi:hypothetical protein
MKRNILFFIMIISLGGLFTMQSCKKDTAVPPEVYGSFTDPVILAPANGGFVSVTGTTIDLKWESTDSDGDAQSWDVYFGTSANPPKVKSGHTTQIYTATVVKGTEYFWRVECKDANGVITRSPIWSFEVIDPAATMSMELNWQSNALDVIGMEIDPLKVANLRLRILKSDKTTAAVTAINTTGFEIYEKFNSLADGKYYIAVDLTSTIDAGDFNAPIDIDIDLAFSQRGVQEVIYNFPAVMTNQFVCSAFRVFLGYVVKTGTSYTFTKEVSKPVSALSGIWYGLDNTTDFEYDSQVETYMGCSLQVKGLSYEWMDAFWGEVIIKGGSASISINTTTGVVTIPNQFYCRTKWNGAVQPDYYIEGTGTYDATGAYPTMTITYDLLQNGVSMADQDGGADAAFIAVLTKDPAGLKGVTKGIKQIMRPAVKPAH